ncbi:flavodoxin [Gilvimarinus polysaccharolyticus]|uniref:flavodoxin n=1 Tax=Gilvimarinus polysaccharolyticus TaxID=863921 RepID=UPI0006739CF6|nr:flavodoxin [Gilvimarinus polysaccharolyticus]
MKDLTHAHTGLIYGTDTGNTEEVGDKIASALAAHGVVVEMLNVSDASPEQIEQFDFIIMGIPTWDFGGIQEDWENFEEQILATKLTDKTVALYGLGDQLGYGYYFVDAMGWLNERVLKAGATVIGHWPCEGYTYDESLAVNAEKTEFCGLAIDDEQQFELTDERIERWVWQITQEYLHTCAA